MWRLERLRRRRDLHRMAHELVADCDAFLAGRYVERLEARGDAVPVWAWTNLLAHGREEDLRGAVAALPEGLGGWRETRAELANTVLNAVGPQSSLARLQAAVLAPLELRLAGRTAVARWDRRIWEAAVRAALAEHRPSHQA